MTWNAKYWASTPTPAQYAYYYDDKYQLKDAVFGSHSISTNQFTVDPNHAYVEFIDYDTNGNITTMARWDQSGNYTADAYIYVASAKNNRLTATQDNVSGNGRSYSCDASGQIISSVTTMTGEKNKYVEYDGEG